MFKIGGVSIDVSHPKAFSETLEKSGIEMKYEYIKKASFRSDDELSWFISRFALKGGVENYDEAAKSVDIGFVQSCNWDKHLDEAMPFIRAGKPVFIDKPVVGSVKDIARLRKLVSGGAKIIGSSSVRYAYEIRDFLAVPVSERGEITSIYCTCGVDEFNYSVHAVEAFSALAEADATECKFVGSGVVGGLESETYTMKFENGVMATYTTVLNSWRPFHLTILTTKGSYQIEIDSSKIYEAMLKEIHAYLSGEENRLVGIEKLINCTHIMLCGKKSRDERRGEWVRVDELTDADAYDGYAFEKSYAKSASKIYKD